MPSSGPIPNKVLSLGTRPESDTKQKKAGQLSRNCFGLFC